MTVAPARDLLVIPEALPSPVQSQLAMFYLPEWTPRVKLWLAHPAAPIHALHFHRHMSVSQEMFAPRKVGSSLFW